MKTSLSNGVLGSFLFAITFACWSIFSQLNMYERLRELFYLSVFAFNWNHRSNNFGTSVRIRLESLFDFIGMRRIQGGKNGLTKLTHPNVTSIANTNSCADGMRRAALYLG